MELSLSELKKKGRKLRGREMYVIFRRSRGSRGLRVRRIHFRSYIGDRVNGTNPASGHRNTIEAFEIEAVFLIRGKNEG